MSGAIFILAEHLEGRLTEATFEAIAAARPIARALSLETIAVLGGAANAGLADELGAADRVLHLADPRLDVYSPDAYESALRATCAARSPRLVLVPNTTVGMDLAAGLAGLLELPLAAYCVSLGVEGGAVIAKCQVYGGKIIAAVAFPDRGVVSLVPGSFAASEGKKTGRPQIETLGPVEGTSLRLRVVAYSVAETADVDITKQPILVSVGRGIGGPENIPLAEELATALGGVVSASRPVTDSGWLPKSRQVGKSGLTVTPKLYLAIGISGAPEHLQGMKDSELIVAVNSDPSAPIFGVAHYGIVGDAMDVVPEITRRLQG
ncbi:MAG: electron transfer flavoprotein subunit alpha/FixB family protein [Chloroflexota bacterium]